MVRGLCCGPARGGQSGLSEVSVRCSVIALGGLSVRVLSQGCGLVMTVFNYSHTVTTPQNDVSFGWNSREGQPVETPESYQDDHRNRGMKAHSATAEPVRAAAHTPVPRPSAQPRLASHKSNRVCVLPCNNVNKACDLLRICSTLALAIRVTHVSLLLLRASLQWKLHWPQFCSQANGLMSQSNWPRAMMH